MANLGYTAVAYSLVHFLGLRFGGGLGCVGALRFRTPGVPGHSAVRIGVLALGSVAWARGLV